MACHRLNYTHQLQKPFVGLFSVCRMIISYESRDRSGIVQYLANSRMNRSIQLLQNLSAALSCSLLLLRITLNWPHLDICGSVDMLQLPFLLVISFESATAEREPPLGVVCTIY